MEEEIRDYQRAQDEALAKRQLLEQTLKDLEYELEAKTHLKDDRGRLVKQMEVCRPCGREPGPVQGEHGAQDKWPLCAYPRLWDPSVFIPRNSQTCVKSFLDLRKKLVVHRLIRYQS